MADSMRTGRGDDQFMIRFPSGMRDQIKSAADINGRSMNAEIVLRLERSFSDMRPLQSALADMLDQHIEREVSARLRAIAAQIGGA